MEALLILVVIGLGLAVIVLVTQKRRAEATLEDAQVEHEANIAAVRRDAASAAEATKHAHDARLAELHAQAETALGKMEAAAHAAQHAYDTRVGELQGQAEAIRAHYEEEAQRAIAAMDASLTAARMELATLRDSAGLKDAEADVRRTLTAALQEAAALQQEAQSVAAEAKRATAELRQDAQRRAREILAQAETRLAQATQQAGTIVAAAEKRAEEVGGDAYRALRDKELIEEAAKAIRNVIEGYGDRYVIPTHSLLDELAADLGHTQAGEALRAAREHSQRMVEHGQAAACDYVEANRRETAIRFVVDAFNGRVDATLSTVKTTNFGTLEQQIRDAFSLVNLNGQAFRNARILPTYLDARLAELKWAVAAQELKAKEREEQRQLQERIREEEKARREYEKAIQEAAREEATLKQAVEKARAQAEHATAQERSKYETQLAELNRRLAEAEAKNERAMSMAQQTRSGHVYVVSNVGSFGEEVIKIGMTRRLEPLDRIKELSDASVPFDFDIHAMIRSDDAPTLERKLHETFEDLRINKVNYRKEFFRIPLERIRAFAADNGLEATFTLAAEAREYRETVALEKMSPEARARYRMREPGEADGAV
jgi:Meiotically up-regulated gene 113/Domain of unknown function (DUF4041)